MEKTDFQKWKLFQTMAFLVVSQKNYQNIIFDQFVELKNEFFFEIRKHSELVRQQLEMLVFFHWET